MIYQVHTTKVHQTMVIPSYINITPMCALFLQAHYVRLKNRYYEVGSPSRDRERSPDPCYYYFRVVLPGRCVPLVSAIVGQHTGTHAGHFIYMADLEKRLSHINPPENIFPLILFRQSNQYIFLGITVLKILPY